MTGLFPYLPVFMDLAGRAAVLLSGRAAFAPVARRLLDSGAGVSVFDPDPSPEMGDLVGGLKLVRRRWRTTDVMGASLVVAAPGERRLVRARFAARSAGALFVVHGAEGASDVSFGAASIQGPMAIGVTVAGLSPALGETMAQRLQSVVPAPYVAFLTAAAALDGEIRRALPDEDARDAFWRDCARTAFDSAPDDWRRWIEERLARVRS